MSVGWRAAMVAALSVSGCSAEKGVYPFSAKEVRERLLAADPIPFRRTVQCGILISFHPYSDNDREVAWEVTSEGGHMLSFKAQIDPVDDTHSKVLVAVVPKANGKPAYDEHDFYPRPAVRMPFQPAAAEWVDALLSGREIDGQNFGPASDNNSVCEVQKGGLESGRPFHVDMEKDERWQ